MSRGIIALVCLFASSFAFTYPVQSVQFERLFMGDSQDSELSGGIGPLKKILQDSDGFIWFGGESGLVRYDAHRYKSYHPCRQRGKLTASLNINDILIDQKGVLWLATMDTLCRYDQERDKFIAFDEYSRKLTLSGAVKSISVSKDNTLYIGTSEGFSVLNAERNDIIHYRTDFDPAGRHDTYIGRVLVDKEQNVWIGSARGFSRYFPEQKTFRHWYPEPEKPGALGFKDIYALAEDAQGNIWLSSEGAGFARFDPRTETFVDYRKNKELQGLIAQYPVADMLLDRDDNFWLALDHGGVVVMRKDKHSYSQYLHNGADNSSLTSNQVRTLFEDRLGNIWVGTFPQGVNFYDVSKQIFTTIKHDPNNPDSLSHDGVTCIYEDRQNVLWIGTEEGLNRYNRDEKTFTRYQHKDGDPSTLRFNAVLDIEEDYKGQMWVATWSGGLHRFDRESETFTNYFPDKNKKNGLPSPFSWTLENDSKGRLWLGSTEFGGLSLYQESTDDFQIFQHNRDDNNSIASDHVWDVVEDSEGMLWLATANGLDRFDPESKTFEHFVAQANDPHSISGNRVRVLYEDSKRNIWIGTDGEGLNYYERSSGKFFQIEANNVAEEHSLASVFSIIEDKSGDMWFGSVNGLIRRDTETGSIKIYYKSDGLAGNSHNRKAAYVDDEGLLYFGSTSGITRFDPSELKQKEKDLPLRITKFRILDPGGEKLVEQLLDSRAIDKTQEIVLEHMHSMFAFEYALLSYRASYRNEYAYMLEGFDENWNYVGRQNSATYTNIGPGQYVFRVKGKNTTGEWSEHEASIEITILPSPWQSKWAYFLYIVLLAILLFWLTQFNLKRIELNKQKILNRRLQGLDKAKDIFLSRTAHELRTPLNGMIGVAESLVDENDELAQQQREKKLDLIVSSGKRLSNLVNDILDYSKIEESNLELHCGPTNVYEVVEFVFSLVEPLAEPKKISLQNHIAKDSRFAHADENRLQQILLNLIGNAIKYSDGGFVKVSSRSQSGMLEIKVADSGIGIPEDKLETIFSSYQQLAGSSVHNRGGTGLGLSISKKLVELHGGTMGVTSTLGEGSEFIFTINPLLQTSLAEAGELLRDKPAPEQKQAKTHALPNKNKTPPSTDVNVAQKSGKKPEKAKDHLINNASSYTVLIVDDDPVNRMILDGMLKTHDYTVQECSSGTSAVELITKGKLVPDLVIMDVLMPGLSGFEACAALRDHYSSIAMPIIFLSAKKLEEDLKTGFAVGGNDFLEKPVSKTELLIKVANQLKIVDIYRGYCAQPKE